MWDNLIDKDKPYHFEIELEVRNFNLACTTVHVCTLVIPNCLCFQSRVYRKRQVIAIRDEVHSQREDSPFDSPPCKCLCVHACMCMTVTRIGSRFLKNIYVSCRYVHSSLICLSNSVFRFKFCKLVRIKSLTPPLSHTPTHPHTDANTHAHTQFLLTTSPLNIWPTVASVLTSLSLISPQDQRRVYVHSPRPLYCDYYMTIYTRTGCAQSEHQFNP